MNRENEKIFSSKKLKRIFFKYWYIVLITFILGVVCVGVMTFKTISSSTSQNTTTSNQATSGSTSSVGASSSATPLSPSGTVYFNVVRYIKVDWSEIYPDVSISNENSHEDNYYIINRITNQNNYEKDILTNCKNILNYDSFKSDINNALTNGNFTTLTNIDSISCDVLSNDILKFTVYGQCSVDRIRCILDASVDSFIKKGQTNFNLGKCSIIETNDVYAYNKEKDGKFTSLNMTANEWLVKETAKGNAVTVSTSDTVTTDQANQSSSNISFKDALVSKKILLYC